MNFLIKINFFARTVLSLKGVQIFYRLWYLVRSKLGLISTSKNLGNHELTWYPNGFKAPFICYRQWQKWDIENRSFEFLNETICFDSEVDWGVSEKGRLWCYNLHYFQYLLLNEGINAGYAVDLIKNWIEKNSVGSPDAWDPFPISLRLVNWIKFLSLNNISEEDKAVIVDSMAFQTRWLLKHLEYHLLGNHMFKNGKALMFMGLFFNGIEAGKWLEKGLTIVGAELDEQVLDDGGHFERSPMYHSMVLEDCLDLLNIVKAKKNSALKGFADTLEEKTGKMVRYLSSMTHPDGRIGLFNDAAFGIETAPDGLFGYYKRVTGKELEMCSDNVQIFQDSGYYILAPDSETKMILDCGHVGPEYQPGHSHCDTLSFELSVKGMRVIVDSGCFQYEDGDIREYNRGNIGHNTITIDDENQSEVWGAHRCARKAAPLEVECGEKENGVLFFKGGHDGYKRLKGKPVHFREVTFQDKTWKIRDRIEGKKKHTIESRLHLHPSMELEFEKNEIMVGTSGKRVLKIQLRGNGVIKIEKGWYCPEFGKKYACDVLVYQEDLVDLPFESGWELEMVN